MNTQDNLTINITFTEAIKDSLLATIDYAEQIYLSARKSWYKFHVEVLKRQFGVETATYRKWWKRHSAIMQDRLEQDRAARNGVVFYIDNPK